MITITNTTARILGCKYHQDDRTSVSVRILPGDSTLPQDVYDRLHEQVDHFRTLVQLGQVRVGPETEGVGLMPSMVFKRARPRPTDGGIA